MELKGENNSEKIFVEGNTTYTMRDLSNYFNNNQGYEEVPKKWYLMIMEEATDKNSIFVLPSYNKSGMMFITIQINNISRTIHFHNGFVESDFLDVSGEFPNFKRYYALKDGDKLEDKYQLQSYIVNPLPIDLKGDTINGEIPDISILTKFFDANNRLNKMITGEQEFKL